jgi:hypothetical protein
MEKNKGCDELNYKTDKEFITEFLKNNPGRRKNLHALFKADTMDAALKIVRELRRHPV